MHAELISQRIPGTALAAVYDVFDGAAASVAAAFGARHASNSAELIEADDVDAVAICSSTDTHIDLLVEAAAAGKPAFVEKPLSLDLAEVDRGIAAATEAGIAVQVGFNRRFDAAHRHVRDRVAAGDVGDVHLVRISSRDPDPPPISYIKVSGGIFCDMTIHDFDMARFVTGSDAVEVYATGGVRVDPAIGEAGDLDTAVVVVTHASGAITTIDNSRRAVYGYDQRLEAFGSAGMASSDNPPSATARYWDGDGVHGEPLPYFFLDRYIPSYLAEWNAFVAMVGGAPSPVNLADGRAPLVMGLAAWKSVREDRPVAIEDVG
ncbi:MAG: inositol 2-dehydrogenase [Acidimicrobiia bacterium]|nr:inositol 2-dehydrogenase [Acidimicrobiia bacterium]